MAGFDEMLRNIQAAAREFFPYKMTYIKFFPICAVGLFMITLFIDLILIRRKKTTIIFSLQNMFRILLYPSSVAIILNC